MLLPRPVAGLVVAAGAVLACASRPLAAAELPVLTPDQPIEASLAPGDLTGQRFTASFGPRTGGTWSIRVVSDLFNPRLEIRAGKADGSWEVVGQARSTRNINPWVTFEAAPGAAIEVSVDGEDGLACGAAFRIHAIAGPPPPRTDAEKDSARDLYWSDLLRTSRERGDAACEVRALLGQHAAARRAGHLEESLPLVDEAIVVAEGRLDASNPFIAWALDAKGRLLREQGQLNEALPLLERAARIIEAHYGPVHPETADELQSLAALYGNLDRDRESQALIERTLDIRQRTLAPGDMDIGWAMNDLAIAFLSSGDLPQASSLMQQVVASVERQTPIDREDLASALNNLGYMQRQLGDDEGARRTFEKSLDIYHTYIPSSRKAIARITGNLARVMENLGDPAASRALYEEALSISQSIYGAQHVIPAGYDLRIARLLAREGRNDEAVERAAKAAAVFESSLGPQHSRTADALVGQAEIELQVGAPDKALPLVDRAISIGETLLGPTHPDLAAPLRLRATIDLALGRSDAALAAALRAEDLGRDQLRLTARALAEAPALRYAATRPRGLDVALRLASAATAPAPDLDRQVWDSLIRSRALVLDEMARRRLMLASGDPETARLRDEFAGAGARLARLLVRAAEGDAPGDVLAQIETARRERDRKEEALAAKSAAFQAGRLNAAAGFEEIARRLGPADALVSYARVDRAAGGRHQPGTAFSGAPPDEIYVAFVARGPDGAPRLVPLGSAATIDAAVTRWRASLVSAPQGLGASRATRERDARAAGDALRSAIWDPVAAALARDGSSGSAAGGSAGTGGRAFDQGVATVFVVPDGALALVNLAALPVGERRFLIESKPAIQVLSAERDLAANALPGAVRAAADPGRALVIGGPDFDAGSGGPLSAIFPSLPEAAAEAGEVAASLRRTHLAEVTLLTGRGATESAFERLAPGSRYVHLATHAFWSGAALAAAAPDARPPAGNPGSRSAVPAVARVPAAAPPADVLVHGAENPLDFSGVALAGANRRAADPARPAPVAGGAAAGAAALDDGILTADEVATLDLTAADWVVLSGCDTGVGAEAKGEGLLGLQRAFRVAGARGLVVSLWPVPDVATREWMRLVYAEARAGASPAGALRGAARRWLAAQRAAGASLSPEVWGAFIATGPGR